MTELGYRTKAHRPWTTVDKLIFPRILREPKPNKGAQGKISISAFCARRKRNEPKEYFSKREAKLQASPFLFKLGPWLLHLLRSCSDSPQERLRFVNRSNRRSRHFPTPFPNRSHALSVFLFLSLYQNPTQIPFKNPTPLPSPPTFGVQLVPKSYHLHSYTLGRIKKSRGRTTGSQARTEFWAIWRYLEGGMAREGWGGAGRG